MYSYTINGTSFNSPLIGIEDLQRTIVREWGGSGVENILRTKSESSVTFTEDAYCYVCQLFDSFCDLAYINIYDESNNLFYEGTFTPSMVVINLTKKTAETKLKDTSFSAMIRDRANNEIFLKSVKTFDCSDDMTPIPVLSLDFASNSTLDPTTFNDRVAFDVLDILKYQIAYLTNNQVTVSSNYFTTNQYALLLGSALSAQPVVSPYFKISFEKLFTELRKLFCIYARLDGNVLTIEPENTFFTNTNILTFPSLPYDVTKQIDEDRIVNKISGGSNKTDISDDYTSNLPFFVNKWNEVQYNNCGCSYVTDNELDITTEFVIDSDVIFDTLYNGGNEEDLFLIEMLGGNVALYIQPPLAARWYNNSLRNSEQIQRWENYVIGCVYATRGEDYFRSKGTKFVQGQSFNMIFDNFMSLISGCTALQKYPQLLVDTFNGYSNKNQGVICNSVNQDYTEFIITQDGTYAFRASRITLWAAGASMVVNYIFSIRIYTDNSLSTLITTYTTAGASVTIPNVNPYYVLPLTVESTSPIVLTAGNVVVVNFFFARVSGTAITSVNMLDGQFEIASDLLECENLPDFNEDNYPYVYTFEGELCNNDFETIVQNKDGVIELNGNECYVSEITQGINGTASFRLISNKNICNE
jgi:hypothetical protein